MSTQYQLVIQWDDETGDFDFLVRIEDVLIASLSEIHDVDGHDMGRGEANIFIITPDPLLAFDEIKPVLAGQLEMSDVRIGYRAIHEDTFTVLWPEGLDEFNVA